MQVQVLASAARFYELPQLFIILFGWKNLFYVAKSNLGVRTNVDCHRWAKTA